MGNPTKGRHPQRDAFGERVARERAARRRKAKERTAREQSGRETVASTGTPLGEPDVVEIPQSDLMNETTVLATLIAAGLARHHPEARRLFRDTGVLVNDEPVLTDKAKLRLADVRDGVIKLGLGDGRQVLLRPV